MLDYSRLPRWTPVTLQNEERWEPINALAVILVSTSWFNLLLVSNFLWDEVQHPLYYRPFHSATDFSPFLIVINLGVWWITVKRFPRFRWWAKLPALVSIILWFSVVIGIQWGLLIDSARFQEVS